MRCLPRLLCTFLVLSGVLHAAERFVSPSGSNGNPGTEAQPWLTLTFSVSQLSAGDTLFARSGVYGERLILTGKSGAPGLPITVRNYPGEAPVIDGAAITVPSGGRQGLLAITDGSYLVIQGFEIRNFTTTAGGRIPIGIQVEGTGTGVQLIGNKIHHIWQSSTNQSANGFGIAIYGTGTTPIDAFVLEGNEVYDLRTGQSESVSLNGNVANFAVRNNVVHDCNNIGIDFIGYEGSTSTGIDRARNGVCSGNTVYNINSAYNPGYGGNFVSGGGDQSAAGIYVDGGTQIVVERNRTYHCNFGIELASEHAVGATDYIILRNNLVHHNLSSGLTMGGYDASRGITDHCQITNNVFYQNDTELGGSGQVSIQYYYQNNLFKNNIIWANSSGQMIIHYVTGTDPLKKAFPPGNVFDYNVYYFSGNAGDAEFGLNPTGSSNQSYYGLPAWRTAIGGEANSAFNIPGFVTSTPSANPSPADFKLADPSFCRDRGEPPPAFVPGVAEKDFFGASRVANNRVDIGFHEFMTIWQAWRDQYFALPDGGGVADALADPEADGASSLLEFSQGMNPTLGDPTALPKANASGGNLRFTYRKDQPSLFYGVETSSSLPGPLNWSSAIPTEQADGNGHYWRDFPLTGGPLFIRLRISQ